MSNPAFDLFVFYANGRVVNLSNSRDSWTVRTDENYVSQPDLAHQLGVRTCDAYIKLEKRSNGSWNSIKALVMSYYIIQEVEFTPGREVKLTVATAGSFLYGIRLLYLKDQNALNYYVPKAFLVPGDGYSNQVDDLAVSSKKNTYFIHSRKPMMIYTLYPTDPWVVKMSAVQLQPNVLKEITPANISVAYRYMHILYFDTKSGSGDLTAKAGLSSHLCVVCLTNEADLLFAPCNHVVTCLSCRNSLPNSQCPICRRPFSNVHKVFFS